MRQLEYLIGKEAFKEGIQEYIKTYANSNADWNELVSILDHKTDSDLKKWSNVWVHSSGRPIFSKAVQYDEKGKVAKFVILQKSEDGSDKIWTQSFKIQMIDKKGNSESINLQNMGKSFDISEAVKDFKPVQILYNTNGFGYGVFPIYTDGINAYKSIQDEVSRGYQFINLYENMLLGEVSPKETYQVFLEAIQQEENELITNYLANTIQTIFWTFLTENQQNNIQKKTENQLYTLLQKELPANIKKTLFGLYESIAISEAGKENLYQIWKEQKKIKNLFLNENEFTSLAMSLVLFKHLKAVEIVQEQQARISNKDRLARFKWLLPSLSDDVIVRDYFMKSLLQKEHREKEAWVQAALSNLHHPLRQQASLKYLKSILEKLEEVQLTGDIFFPKGWLASSIGKYSSKEANAILEQFLAENSNYNPILLKKLLQTTDNLMRAQNIKK